MGPRTFIIALTLVFVPRGPWLVPAHAGPLEPPAGPVAPTGPTMIHAIPYTITSPGSYILARSLQGGGGITVQAGAGPVTIDLGGHALTGPGLDGSSAGISLNGAGHVTVRNGTIGGWPGGGISGGASHCRLESLTLAHNVAYFGPPGAVGINISVGNSSAVIRCIARGGGIYAGDRALVAECIADVGGESTEAIRVGAGSVVRACTARNALHDDRTGILAGESSSVADCAVEIASPNGVGIVAGGGSQVEGCTVLVSANAAGVNALAASTVRACHVRSAFGLLSNASQGILAGPGGAVTDCSVNGLFATGIDAADRCTVSRCDVKLDHAEAIGVRALSFCRIESNTLQGPGSAVSCTGSVGTRIDANSIASGAIILTGSTRCLVIRNFSTAPSPFPAAAGNAIGPIVDATGGGDLAGLPNGAHPWANFRH